MQLDLVLKIWTGKTNEILMILNQRIQTEIPSILNIEEKLPIVFQYSNDCLKSFEPYYYYQLIIYMSFVCFPYFVFFSLVLHGTAKNLKTINDVLIETIRDSLAY